MDHVRRARVAGRGALVGMVLAGATLAATPHLAARERGAPAPRPLPPSTLAVWHAGAWHVWWRSAEAPERWPAADARLAGALRWRPLAEGVDWGELRLAGTGEAWRLRVVVVRLDPRRVRLRLDTAFTAGGENAAWSVDRAGRDALVAVNAGQFVRAMPWGWVVLDGREFLPPGAGPLATAVAVDTTGRVRWLHGDAALGDAEARRGATVAFQSYPTLLADDGTIPPALRAPGGGIDVAHRDARLALGAQRDGRLLLALTRFDGAGRTLDFVPFGLTTPEMAALMGALGARDAVMLDGGISSQLLLRAADGRAYRWPGLRRVPLGLVAVRR